MPNPLHLLASALLVLAASCAGPGVDAPAADAQLVVVVKFESRYDADEIKRRYPERMPRFRALEGLVQKYYLHDPATDSWCGVYVWETKEAAQAYLTSDLRRSIPEAYGVVGTPRVEAFEVIDVLR